MKIDFYQGFDPEAAADIERLSRLIYELRQNRARILQPYEVSHESELVRRIADGKLDEHPAYEHYLSARILADTCESVRMVLAGRLRQEKAA
ncbi:MAG: hypothetical protein KF909_12710 [Rhodocyclaceae bacterium]|uniref:hypothetical protein n=1 Tax=Cognatazoarcus halotolerans TaxID=2686016 RepID=UPI00135A1FC2|nr:hypothetical protein [Cognatazoarcus halotolerans]MBX3686994.1 hypothetical protein [Rhodocyclaceae bacterium]MCB1910467.1 hypothetical protein [Rhodocyclaceae bacterium]MCP5239171.1 hypothetical protein [Zoogloeaceae bacterium]MCW5615819.1 hypothetical protein [Rhodocyclaceae bacterium]